MPRQAPAQAHMRRLRPRGSPPVADPAPGCEPPGEDPAHGGRAATDADRFEQGSPQACALTLCRNLGCVGTHRVED
eukprot:scaffold6824_cov118-Isochrysis_galbana.AAC.6